MASLVKLQIDSVAYDWNVRRWEMLTGMTPESVVLYLSEGRGIRNKSTTEVSTKINKLMGRLDEFVPRVRLSSEVGKILRSEIADWYSHLHHLKVAFSRKCKVIYLKDEVNEILRKPHVDEVARLTDSIRTEIQLVKDKKDLTPDQRYRYDVVYCKIQEHKKVLKELPRCTNDIITIFLLELLDAVPVSLRMLIERLTDSMEYFRKTLADLQKKLSDNTLAEEQKEKVRRQIETTSKEMTSTANQRETFLSPYYDKLTPDNIAAYLTKYSGTFWDKRNVKKNPIDISFRIAAKKKASKSKKSPVSQLEHAKSLMLFPFLIAPGGNYQELMQDLDNDKRVIDQFVEWAKGRSEHDYTDEYRSKYGEFWKMLKTIPVLTVDEVMKYATSLCKSENGSIPDWIQRNRSDITEFCSRPGARRLFNQWKKEFGGTDDATFHSTYHKAKSTILFERINSFANCSLMLMR